MKLNLQELELFSQCPRYYWEKKISPVRDRQFAIITHVIKKCYITATETQFKATWRTVVGWVDALVFKNISLDNDEAFQSAKSVSEYALIALQSWYHSYYLEENLNVFTDLDLGLEDRYYFYDKIDAIQLSNPVRLIVFTREDITPRSIKNNLRNRGQCVLVSSNLDCKDLMLRVHSIKERGGFTTFEKPIDTLDNNRVQKIMVSIGQSIERKVNYPSRISACNQCQLDRRCRL